MERMKTRMRSYGDWLYGADHGAVSTVAVN